MRRRGPVGRAVPAVAAVLASLVLTGCWDAIPLGHRALVQMLAVDPAKGGDMRWTFFQANLTALAQMGSGGGSAGPGGGTTDQQVIPTSVVAPDLAEAFRKAQTLTSRDLYLGQMEEVVLSEKLSAAQLAAALDGLAHTPELDQSQTLFAAQSDAAATMLKPDPQELFPSTYLNRLVSCPTCSVVHMPTTLMAAFVRSRTAWGSMILPEVQAGPNGIATRGAAVYEGTRLVGRLDSYHEVLLGLLVGKVGKGALQVDVPGVGQCSIRSMKSKSHLQAAWQGGRIHASLHVDVQATLLAVMPNRGVSLASIEPRVASALSEAVVKRAAPVLQSLMSNGADPLLIGDHLWAADPSRAPSPAAWQRDIRQARVAITVQTQMRSSGGVR